MKYTRDRVLDSRHCFQGNDTEVYQAYQADRDNKSAYNHHWAVNGLITWLVMMAAESSFA
jgi:hypothetical protein